MPPTYSTQLCSPTHPSNKPTPCCYLDAHNKKDYILCATCYKYESKPVLEDDWDDKSLRTLATYRRRGNNVLFAQNVTGPTAARCSSVTW